MARPLGTTFFPLAAAQSGRLLYLVAENAAMQPHVRVG